MHALAAKVSGCDVNVSENGDIKKVITREGKHACEPAMLSRPRISGSSMSPMNRYVVSSKKKNNRSQALRCLFGLVSSSHRAAKLSQSVARSQVFFLVVYKLVEVLLYSKEILASEL